MGSLLAFTMFPIFSTTTIPITGKCQTFSQLFHRLPMCVAQFEGVEHFLADVVVRLDNSDLSCVYYY